MLRFVGSLEAGTKRFSASGGRKLQGARSHFEDHGFGTHSRQKHLTVFLCYIDLWVIRYYVNDVNFNCRGGSGPVQLVNKLSAFTDPNCSVGISPTSDLLASQFS